MTVPDQRWNAPEIPGCIDLGDPKAGTKGWVSGSHSLGEDPSKERNGQLGETESASEESQNCLPKGKGVFIYYLAFGIW